MSTTTPTQSSGKMTLGLSAPSASPYPAPSPGGASPSSGHAMNPSAQNFKYGKKMKQPSPTAIMQKTPPPSSAPSPAPRLDTTPSSVLGGASHSPGPSPTSNPPSPSVRVLQPPKVNKHRDRPVLSAVSTTIGPDGEMNSVPAHNVATSPPSAAASVAAAAITTDRRIAQPQQQTQGGQGTDGDKPSPSKRQAKKLQQQERQQQQKQQQQQQQQQSGPDGSQGANLSHHPQSKRLLLSKGANVHVNNSNQYADAHNVQQATSVQPRVLLKSANTAPASNNPSEAVLGNAQQGHGSSPTGSQQHLPQGLHASQKQLNPQQHKSKRDKIAFKYELPELNRIATRVINRSKAFLAMHAVGAAGGTGEAPGAALEASATSGAQTPVVTMQRSFQNGLFGPNFSLLAFKTAQGLDQNAIQTLFNDVLSGGIRQEKSEDFSSVFQNSGLAAVGGVAGLASTALITGPSSYFPSWGISQADRNNPNNPTCRSRMAMESIVNILGSCKLESSPTTEGCCPSPSYLVAALAVVHMLRTHLGSPDVTLDHFEAALHGDPAAISFGQQHHNQANKGKEGAAHNTSSFARLARNPPTFSSLRGVKSLVDFFFHLDRLILACSSAPTSSLSLLCPQPSSINATPFLAPSQTYQIITFFRTNSQACSVRFFANFRLWRKVLLASNVAGDHRATVAVGMQAISTLVGKVSDPSKSEDGASAASAAVGSLIEIGDLEAAIAIVVEAMANVGVASVDMMAGLADWVGTEIATATAAGVGLARAIDPVTGSFEHSKPTPSTVGFTTSEIQSRLGWIQAKMLRSQGRLEEAAAACCRCLGIHDYVYCRGTFRGNGEPLAGAHVVANLSHSFFSLSGVQAAVQTAVDSFKELGDYERLERLFSALEVVRSHIHELKILPKESSAAGTGDGLKAEKGNRGKSRKEKGSNNKKGNSIAIPAADDMPDTAGPRSMIPRENPNDGASASSSRTTAGLENMFIPDYMMEAVSKDFETAIDAFMPKIDMALLGAWKTLDELVGRSSISIGVMEPLKEVAVAARGGVGHEEETEIARLSVSSDPPAPARSQLASPTPASITALLRQLTERTEKFGDMNLALAYRVDIPARIEAVERVILFNIARLDKLCELSAEKIAKSHAVANIAQAGACILSQIEIGIDPSSMKCGHVGHLVEALSMTLKAISGEEATASAGPGKKPVSKRIHHDSLQSNFSSLMKLQLVRSAIETHDTTPNSALSLVKLARKQNNFETAARLLEFSRPDEMSAGYRYEAANLAHALRSHSGAVIEVLRNAESAPPDNHYKVRSYLRAAKWLLQGKASLCGKHDMIRDIDNMKVFDKEVARRMTSVASFDPICDVLDNGSYLLGLKEHRKPVLFAGQCLRQAVELSPTQSKPFFRLGDWAFSIWLKSVKARSKAEKSLRETEEAGVPGEDADPAFFGEGSNNDADNGEENKDSSEQQTLTKDFYALAEAECLPTILHSRNLAISCYCNFLSLSSKAQASRGGFVTIVTLRLIKLISSRPPLKNTDKILSDLKSTPAKCWSDIVPQLIALVGHKDAFARSIGVEMLCKLAHEDRSTTSLITFAVMRGLATSSAVSENAERTEALRSVKRSVQSFSDTLIDDVQRFQVEMDRLGSLWDEKWFYLLSKVSDKLLKAVDDICNDVRVSAQSKQEFGALMPESDLQKVLSIMFASKFKAFVVSSSMVGELYALAKETLPSEAMDEVNSCFSIVTNGESSHQPRQQARNVWGVGDRCVPSTPAESEFQSTYSRPVVELFHFLAMKETRGMNSSSFEYANIKSTARQVVVTNLLKSFQKNRQPLSPGVSDSRSLKHCCPGLNTILRDASHLFSFPLSSKSSARMKSCIDLVEVIESKTTPKKLKFVDEFGTEHSYLLKGREDLRIDERMMQLLEMSNKLLSFDKGSSKRSLATRTYAVLPVSERSGLIKWVDGPISLYELLKRYQLREVERDAIVKEIMDVQGSNAVVPGGAAGAAGFRAATKAAEHLVKQPGEGLRSMFQTEVLNVLGRGNAAQAGATAGVAPSRSALSHETLREVFKNLRAKCPSKLLADELFAASKDPADWYAKTLAFSRSVASSSAMGHIIGLGDRHPANLLLDVGSGQVVHIDYGVIFGGGAKLAVPEIVPFRLTDSIVNAMGIGGVEGCFKKGMEHTIRVMKSNRECLLTLLEVFVLDPVFGNISVGTGGRGVKSSKLRGVAAAAAVGDEAETKEGDLGESGAFGGGRASPVVGNKEMAKGGISFEGAVILVRGRRTGDARTETIKKVSKSLRALKDKCGDATASVSLEIDAWVPRLATMIDCCLSLTTLGVMDGDWRTKVNAGDGKAEEALKSFMAGEMASIEFRLRELTAVYIEVWANIGGNRPYPDQCSSIKLYKDEWEKMCTGNPEVFKVGMVKDTLELVREALDALLSCASIVDDYKANEEISGAGDYNLGVFHFWLERANLGRSRIGGGGTASGIGENLDSMDLKPFNQTLMDKIFGGVRLLNAVLAKLEKMEIYLPTLSSRIGDLGKRMNDMFSGLTKIVKERTSTLEAIIYIKTGVGGKGDEGASINWDKTIGKADLMPVSGREKPKSGDCTGFASKVKSDVLSMFQKLEKHAEGVPKERYTKALIERLNSNGTGTAESAGRDQGRSLANWDDELFEHMECENEWEIIQKNMTMTFTSQENATMLAEYAAGESDGGKSLMADFNALRESLSNSLQGVKEVRRKTMHLDACVRRASTFVGRDPASNCSDHEVRGIAEELQVEVRNAGTLYREVCKAVTAACVKAANLADAIDDAVALVAGEGTGEEIPSWPAVTAGGALIVGDGGGIDRSKKAVDGQAILKFVASTLAGDAGVCAEENASGNARADVSVTDLIKMARDEDRLAAMFEGWSAWW